MIVSDNYAHDIERGIQLFIGNDGVLLENNIVENAAPYDPHGAVTVKDTGSINILFRNTTIINTLGNGNDWYIANGNDVVIE